MNETRDASRSPSLEGERESSSSSASGRETNPWALAAVVCAGLSFSFLPLVGTILGFAFAGKAESAIQNHPEQYQGLELVRWARRLAWLGVIILGISALAVGFAYWGMNA